MADRTQSNTPSLAEWNSYINFEAQELYGKIVTSYQDYNVNYVTFSIASGNSIPILSIAPDFRILRQVEVQNVSGNPPYLDVPRLPSIKDQDNYNLETYYQYTAQRAVAYLLIGSNLEFYPVVSAPASYRLKYIPDLPTLVNDSDSFDGYWLNLGGWYESVIFGAAERALLREESLDSAQYMGSMKQRAQERCLAEASPRDDNEPGRIHDVKRRGRRGGSNGNGGYL